MLAVPAKPHDPPALDLRPKPPHFPPQAKAMISLFMHGGPVACRPVGSQARADPARRPDLRRRSQFQFRQRGQSQAAGQPLQVRAPRRVGHRSLRAAPRTRPASSTTSASSARCTPATTATKFRSAIFTAASPASSAGPRSARGWSMAWATSRKNCRPMSCWPIPGGVPVDGASNWSCGFMPPVFQGTLLRSSRAADRQSRSAGPLAWTAAAAKPGPARRAQPPPSNAHPRRGRSGSPHRQLRTGRPHAIGGQRGARHRRRNGGHAKTLRPRRSRHPRIWHPLPDRPPAGRARRAVRAVVSRRPALGHASRHPRQPAADLPADRSARGRAGHRSQSPRACSTPRWSTGAARSAACR